MSSITLNTTDFNKVFDLFMQGKKANMEQAYHIVCCAGKSVMFNDVKTLWPEGKTLINADRCFELYYRLVDLDYTDDELARVEKTKITTNLLIKHLKTGDAKDDRHVLNYLKAFEEGDRISILKLLQRIEDTKIEVLQKILKRQNVYESEIDEDEEKDYAELEKDLEERYSIIVKEQELVGSYLGRGFLTTEPILTTTNYVFTECEPGDVAAISLQIERNSDLDMEKFENDVYAIAYSPDGVILGVTVNKHEDLPTQELWSVEFAASVGVTVSVLCLGTQPKKQKKRSTARVDLLDTKGKITYRFRMTLMNLFESFDRDSDNNMDRIDFGNYAVASGDERPNDESWNLLCTQFGTSEGLGMTAFLNMHQAELDSGGEGAISDMWASLTRLGYDSSLNLINGCPFHLGVHTEFKMDCMVTLEPLKISDLDFFNKCLYSAGEELVDCPLNSRRFLTDYFGVIIIDNRKPHPGLFALEITDGEDCRWNFLHDKEEFSIKKEYKYVMIVAFVYEKKLPRLKIVRKGE